MSSSSSQKHSNLLAAKSALGIADVPSTSSSAKESRISSSTSVHSRDSRGSTISGSASGVTGVSTISGGISASTSGTHTTATSGVREKRSTLHDLSSAARSEARRFSVEESLESRARLNARSSFNSEEKRQHHGVVGSSVASSLAPPARAPIRHDSTPSVASSTNDTMTLEEGSRDDSMAAWSRNSYDIHPIVGNQPVAGRSAVSSRNSTPRSSLTRPDQLEKSDLGMSSSNLGMSSSFNNVYEKKVSLGARGEAGRMDVVDEHTFEDSATFDDSAIYSENDTLNDSPTGFKHKKVSFNKEQDDVRIVERRDRIPPPVSSFHESEGAFEDSGAFERDETYNESETSSQFNESNIQEYETFNQSLVSTGSNFVPQRFDEMRSLLLNITPLQLEALVHEIFSNSPSGGSYLSVNSASDNSRAIPPEWKGIRKKSKRYHFRKDAYLGEMSFEELQNFAQSIELWSIVDNEGCNDHEEAMDIFAIEFEMLVSGYKATVSVNSGSHHQRQLEDDLQSYMSSTSQDVGENLLRSLRACSVPELRLVAERLNLDHSKCGNGKADLIFLIESSMPDMLSNSNRSGNSLRSNPPPPPPPREYLDHRPSTESDGDNAAMYVEESYAQQQQEMDHDRSRRVKFSTDCKEDTSHLIPKREVNRAIWGNYVVDELGDIENNGDGSQPLMYVDKGEIGQTNKSRSLKWPQQRKRFIIIGAFISVIVGIALGLGLGLTKDQREGGGSPSSSTIITGPWTIGFGDSFQTSDQPSMSPSTVISGKSYQNVVVVPSSSDEESEAPSKKPTKEPTTLKPTAAQTRAPSIQPTVREPFNSGGVSSVEIITNSPALVINDNDGGFETMVETTNSTIASLDVTSENESSRSPTQASVPTAETMTANPSTGAHSSPPTIQPTEPAIDLLYPLLGPFDEAGMRMVLYGIKELSSMGQTQWKMLTSAFIEQFYNHGEKGDDAIQNIVFDVNADIEITEHEQLVSADARRLEGACVITFTTTISYHSYSAFLDAATVADRPFIDKEMRSNYIDYLMNNNGLTYIGNIASVSEIFREEEIPEGLLPTEKDDEAVTNASPESSIQTPTPSVHITTPVPSFISTPEPSTEMISIITPRPTISMGELTPRPTQNSFDFDFVGNTLSPVVSYGSTPGTVSPAPSTNNAAHAFSPGVADTPFPTSNAFDWPGEIAADIFTPATNSAIYTDNPTSGEPSLAPTPKPSKKVRSAPPSQRPTVIPTTAPSQHPTSTSPSRAPSLSPTANPASAPMICDLVADCHDNIVEVPWDGSFEIAQTHVVKAIGETRRAPRVIAHREAELLFTPSESRRFLDADIPASVLSSAQRIESVGKVYLVDENRTPLLNELASSLLDGSNTTLFLLDSPGADIVIDLKHLRLIEKISLVFPDISTIESVQVGLRYDDGQEQNDSFHYPSTGWLWHNLEPSIYHESTTVSVLTPKIKARYVNIRLKNTISPSSRLYLQRVEIFGHLDGLAGQVEQKMTPETRAIDPRNTARTFIPSKTTSVRIAVYSEDGRLLGVIDGRDPSKQRTIFESQVSNTVIDPYSHAAWSATLPYNWVDEGNVIAIACVDESRPHEVLVHRLELNNLAVFSEHTISRTKLAIFGTDEDVLRLNPTTFDGRKLARNLHAVMPVAELKWADTDIYHLPYIVVISKDGSPALVTSEEERRDVTGVGTEIQWEVMKNFLTIRHALAQSGLGFALTEKEGNNSPYASHTSVFMGWSLSKQDEDGVWHWEDLGYWDSLAAAAWTGWVAMKAGDECSNYFIHELGHAQSMQHFDNGVATDWGIEDEYPSGDGIYTERLPWGYDSVARQFRTWFDPLDGSGKKDPLNGEGEPPYSQELNCFSQYTPYQAEISQEWAMSTPVLLSASSSGVPRDGAYQFNAERKQYIPLSESDLLNAAGEHAMMPDQVSIPVVTLIGTIGASREVCQTYPALRGHGNTFKFPDPFAPGLSSAFDGASYFVEVRFESGRKIRGLVAVKDVSELSLYSFNVAIDQRPIAVDLYRFIDGSYPNLSSDTQTQLLHIRPIELPPEDPLQGMPRQLRVGRGWLGDSPTPLVDAFCISSTDCESDKHHLEWRGNFGSDSVVYRSTLQGRNDDNLKATVFEIPALRDKDDSQYTITVLAARFYNNGQGVSPLLTSAPQTGEDSSSIDVTHGIRIWAPWELNDSLPVGMYRSLPNSLKISADVVDSISNAFQHNVIEFNVACYIHTVTAAPTFAPTKKPSEGPTPSPVELRYHIDWKVGTCVTEGESSSWAPPYKTKEECCEEHMGYEYNVCLNREG